MGYIIRQVSFKGVVGTTTSNKIWVIPEGADCLDTSHCSGGCGSCSGKNKIKKIAVDTDRAKKFSSGDTITVNYYALHETIGAFIVFMIPLFTALTVLFIWYLVAPTTVESGRAILSSGGGFLGGFILVHLFDRLFRKRFPPTIVSPLHENHSKTTSSQAVTNG